MAHIRVPQGVDRDILFALRTQVGGTLTDDADWVDGTTAGEWPTAEFFTQGGSPTDVTSQMVKDITADTIGEATHKHPDPTTGLWRKSQGRYRVRVNPSVALGDYDLTITYDIGGGPFPETHTVSVVPPGDVDFGDTIASVVDPDDVTAGIQTSLDDDEVGLLIIEASDAVSAILDMCGIDADQFEEVPKAVKSAVIYYTRGLIIERDASAGGIAIMRKEGSKQIRYSASSDKLANSFFSRANMLLEGYCKKHSADKRVRFDTFRQSPNDGQFTRIQNKNRLFLE